VQISLNILRSIVFLMREKATIDVVRVSLLTAILTRATLPINSALLAWSGLSDRMLFVIVSLLIHEVSSQLETVRRVGAFCL
jgi:hypothetical protein